MFLLRKILYVHILECVCVNGSHKISPREEKMFIYECGSWDITKLKENTLDEWSRQWWPVQRLWWWIFLFIWLVKVSDYVNRKARYTTGKILTYVNRCVAAQLNIISAIKYSPVGTWVGSIYGRVRVSYNYWMNYSNLMCTREKC